MVKKILMAAAAITLMMITESVLAQTTDMSKYFTVKELRNTPTTSNARTIMANRCGRDCKA